jgi:predicted Zn-dependent protease
MLHLMLPTPPRATRAPAPPSRPARAGRPLPLARRLGRAAAVALAAVLVAACSTVPYSERTRVILTSEQEEMQLGVQAYQEILGQAQLSQDPYWIEIVERTGTRIAAIADKSLQKDGRPAFAWEFKLIDDPKTVNAFCLPGGKVAFFSGILPICRDEAGVAVVMGHEVAHALARHGGERISQQLVINLGVSILAAMSSKDPDTQAAVAGALGVGFGIAFVLPFSRDHESEADYIGLLMMAEAGYDPREAPRFWERMRALKEQAAGEEGGGGLDLEFLSTHPSDENRISALEANMGEALDYYEKGTGVRLDPHRHVITSE